MILNAIAAKLKQRSKADFKGRHYEAALIMRAVCWCRRYLLLFAEGAHMERSLGEPGPKRPLPDVDLSSGYDAIRPDPIGRKARRYRL